MLGVLLSMRKQCGALSQTKCQRGIWENYDFISFVQGQPAVHDSKSRAKMLPQALSKHMEQANDLTVFYLSAYQTFHRHVMAFHPSHPPTLLCTSYVVAAVATP